MENSLLYLLFVSGIGLFIVLGCSTPKEQNSTVKLDAPLTSNQTVSDEKPIAVSASELTKAYNESKFAADEKFGGKTLAVSGEVKNLEETKGNVTLSLQGHDSVFRVMCNYEESEKPDVSKLKKGQWLTLIGKSAGMTLDIFVGLQGCKIQQND